MTNTAAAENLGGHKVGEASKDKEKVEKRRALGRGLESLLPGPRVVASAPPAQGGGATDKQQVPHRPSPVRNDNPNSNDKSVRNDSPNLSPNLSRPASYDSAGEPFSGTIQAVAEDASQSPPFAKDAKDGAPGFSSGPAEAELRSAGQPHSAPSARSGQAGAAVPTQGHSPYGPNPHFCKGREKWGTHVSFSTGV